MSSFAYYFLISFWGERASERAQTVAIAYYDHCYLKMIRWVVKTGAELCAAHTYTHIEFTEKSTQLPYKCGNKMVKEK